MSDIEENDEFWSLDSMLPPDALKKKYEKSSRTVEAFQMEIDGDEADKGEQIPQREAAEAAPLGGQKIDFSKWLREREEEKERFAAPSEKVICEYAPASPLIKKVTVSEAGAARAYTERFITDGIALYNESAPFEENVGYISFFPQYASLNRAQKKCYIGFRTAVRSGKAVKVDKAYIYLYLYELINITELSSPSERAESMASLLSLYPSCDDKLFADICNFLCDICLIYGIPVPKSVFGCVHPRVLKLARLKEMFVKDSLCESGKGIQGLMLSCSRYDYRTSKFYIRCPELYDKYIEGAVCAALAELADRDYRFRPREDDTCTITHESFFGAYRTLGVRKKIKVECLCLTRGDEEKRIVSELVKYAENCLRSKLGIKQKLTVSYINLETRASVKKYFADNFRESEYAHEPRPVKAAVAAVPEIPEYEKLYEPKRERASFENASEIEERSWGVTEKLVSAFEADEPEENEPEESVKIEFIAPENGEKENSEGDIALCAVGVLRKEGGSAFERLAEANGMFADALADLVNEYLFDKIGDVCVERGDDGYAVAEWYTEEIDELLSETGE